MPMPVMPRNMDTGMGMRIMHTTIMIITIMTMRRTIIMGMITITTMMSIAATTIITATPMLMTTNEPGAAARLTEHEAAALYRLMTWLSPAFPVGGFSYS